MFLKTLKVNNFRNINLETEFSNSINIIISENGTGKSNLFDSIYYLSNATSFKKYSEKNNLNYNSKQEFASIEGLIENQDGLKELKIIFNKDHNGFERKRYEISGKRKSKIDFSGNLYLVLFAPHNINILEGSPELRRDELDLFISTIDNKYEKDLSEYKRVIKNRNVILSKISDNFATIQELKFWNEKLIETGSSIISARIEKILEFSPFIIDQAKLFNNHLVDLELKYSSKMDLSSEIIKDTFRNKIEDNIQKEIIVGRTLYGPHRDDYEFISKGKNLKIYASRGQQRICTMIFKTAMWHYIKDMMNINGLLLLDDIMSELDEDNRKSVETLITNLNTQTIISSANKLEFTDEINSIAKQLNI